MKPCSQQMKKPSGGHTSTKTAWGSDVLSARTVDSLVDNRSRTTASKSKFSHSVFQPTSARSSSTIDDDDYDNQNLGHRGSSRKDELSLDLAQKSRSREDVNLNFSHRSSSREDLQLNRNSLHVDHGNKNMSLLSPSTKGHTMNSIANNMTSQAMSPGTKTPLVDLKNSYQNIKRKTPVNQVRQSPQNVNGRNMAEDYIKICNMSATIIQRWFRRHIKRRKSGEAAMKRLLDTKKMQKEEEMAKERDADKISEKDKKKSREEKARQARQQAIQVGLP